ncbi:Protein-glutamine gamma-glutamyltransferase [Stieleria neptunia]|uniref:Protein-glutamine gamma-glutamyltransferase n=1 Tax=Stieleria neptunia TaxID=2527979 RepID=A0A518HZ91_9BACT|nr:transglutaminase-like domain-containing protein [Stieleria neptunia]QDV46171.1 Protein-glutamine gamma-glutamyltransferase [Stieleria neptunia]
MIDKPIHRRSSLVAADQGNESPATFWLLPGVLLIQAIFVGSAFETKAMTLGAFAFALLVVGFFLQGIGQRAAARAKPLSPNRSPKHTSGPSQSVAPAISSDSRHKDHAGATSGSDHLMLLRKFAMLPVLLLVSGLGVSLRIVHHMSGNLNPVAMVVDSSSHVAFLVIATLWVFYPRRGHPAMLGFGLLLVLTTVTGGGVSQTITGQLVAALATVIAFAFAADHILRRWQRDGSAGRRKLPPQRPFPKPTPLPRSTVSISSHSDQATAGRSTLIYSVLALSVLLMSTSAAGHLVNRIVPGLQLDFFDRLSQSLEAVTANSIIGGSRYVRGSKLGSVRNHMIGDPGEPAVRAFAVTAPGYLRGTVFDFYRDGRWSLASHRNFRRGSEIASILPRAAKVDGPGETELVVSRGVRLDRFHVRKNWTEADADENLLGTIEVHNVPLKGQVVFTALSTDWIEAATSGAMLSHHDMVINGVDSRQPYVLGVSTDAPREALDPLRGAILLDVPNQLRRPIGAVTQSVCDGRLTARSKARAIEDYFQANFRYSLSGVTTPTDLDPIEHFLSTRHPAHCEFFASAAAIMLRTEGVPTRYVTGYVVTERSEGDDYWLARNRDAHAWVEAYDEISQQWFPVEATVGRTYRTLLTEESLMSTTDGAQDGFLAGEEDQSLFGMIVGRLLSFRATDSLTFLFRIAQLPLFCIVVALLWIRHRQKQKAGSDPMEFESRQMLHRVDRKLRKHALIRDRSETLHQFAARVEAVAGERREAASFLTTAAQWYRAYAAARYRGRMPTPMDVVGR